MNTKLKLAIPFIVLGIQTVVIVIFSLLRRYLMAGTYTDFPKLFVFLFSLLTNGAVFSYFWGKPSKLLRTFRSLSVLAVVLFTAEFLLCNLQSFSPAQNTMTIPLDSLTIEGDAEWEGNGRLRAGRDSKLKTGELPGWGRCVTLHMVHVKEPDKDKPIQKIRPFCMTLSMRDNNFSDALQVCGNKKISTYGKDLSFRITPHEIIRELCFEFKDMTDPVYVESITLYDAVPFSFSWWRFLILFVLIGLILLDRQYHFTRIEYDRTRISHRLIAAGMTALCMLSLLTYFNPREKMADYPKDISRANPYEQMLDAFKDGHLYLNIEADESLLNFELPYDRVAKDNNGVVYAWDRSYYNGKYYSYFGATPVLTFYYPLYKLTGKVPTQAQTCFFYAPFTVLFLCLTILAMVRLCCSKPNLVLLLLSMPASTILCGILYCQQFPNMYDVPVAAGLCFLFATLWCGLQAVLSKPMWLRMLLFVLSGISFILCIHSRPSMALSALVLVPFFLGVLFNKQQPWSKRIMQAMGFCIPVLIGAGITMYYNAHRFSSPFDFGAGYQLTISNIQANHLSLSSLPSAIVYYFLQPMAIDDKFPYFTLSYYKLRNHYMYENVEHTMGTLWFPMFAAALLLLPRFFRRQKTGTASVVETRAEVILLFGMALLTAWMDFCIGGVSLRYALDYMPVLLLGSIVVLLSTTRRSNVGQYRLITAAIAVSFLMALLLLIQFSTEGTTGAVLHFLHPELPETLEEILIFWE